MAPTKGSKDARSQPQAASPRVFEDDEFIVTDPTTSIPAYQDEDVIQLARDMQKSVYQAHSIAIVRINCFQIQTRRIARRQKIESDYHATMKNIEDSINAHFTEVSKGM